ncbi:uncharacterized protein V6R79_003909 [Siganus canaliculatus]
MMKEEPEQEVGVLEESGVPKQETPEQQVNSNCNHVTDDVTSCPAESRPEVATETQQSEELPETPQRAEGSLVVIKGGNKNAASEKLQRVRKWSVTTFKCTRQALAEKFGRGSRTVDLDLEHRLELLRDDRQRYDNVTKLAQTLANQLAQFMVTQKTLADAFNELSLKSPELHVEFGLNAEGLKYLSKSNQTLTETMNTFTSDMNTLVNKTIEDTMINAKQYEAARVQYDAYRVDLEELNMGPRDDVTLPKLERAQKEFQGERERYEKIRDDLSVKVKLLQENKVKVLHNHLWLFYAAHASHSLSCYDFLEQNLRKAQENLRDPTLNAPSWLEES